MDNYANFWIKCPREAPFYRPVDEVLKWEFIDPPKPLPASAPPTEETPEGAGEADGAAEEQAPESLARSRPPRARKAVETFVAGPSQRPKPRGAASSANDDDDDDELTQTAVDAEGDAEDRPKKSPAKKSPAKKTARAPAKKATGAPHYCLKQAKVAAQGVCPDKAAPSPLS